MVEETQGGWVFRLYASCEQGGDPRLLAALRADDEYDAEDWVRCVEFNCCEAQVQSMAAELRALRLTQAELSAQVCRA